jgi:antirestriction protein ArdC
MSGAFVCAALSIVPTVRHADYLGAWLQVLREDSRAIIRAVSGSVFYSEDLKTAGFYGIAAATPGGP